MLCDAASGFVEQRLLNKHFYNFKNFGAITNRVCWSHWKKVSVFWHVANLIVNGDIAFSAAMKATKKSLLTNTFSSYWKLDL